ncbi:hypothetical protein BB560_004769, partial [Smittium megazygosporum]
MVTTIIPQVCPHTSLDNNWARGWWGSAFVLVCEAQDWPVIGRSIMMQLAPPMDDHDLDRPFESELLLANENNINRLFSIGISNMGTLFIGK